MKTSIRFVANCVVLFLALLLMTAAASPQAAAQVSVTATTPNSAAQGTINLNVTITGKGFKNGAKAQWFVTGTTNPGGVVVNATAFVNSSTLTANITVSDTAIIGNFDVAVANSDGRTGKGTELFAVQSSSNNGTKLSMCTAKPLMTPVNSCTSGGSGCYDTTWGGTGMVLTNTDGNVPPANDGEWGVVVGIQPDGKIVSIGQSSDPSVYSIQRPTVVRYNFDGSLDTTFAVNGVAMTSYGTGFMATSGLLQPDGKIVVVGWTMGSTGKVTVARFNSDGTQDQTFAGGGSTILPGMYTGYTSAALQSDGKIVLASGENTWTLARLNSDGALDGSFGTGGIVTVNFGKRVSRTQLMSVAIQLVTVNGTTQERIVIGGDVDGVAAVKRFLPTGALDTSFGSGGTATAAFCGAVSRINRLAIDSNNRIVAVGQMSQVSNGTGYAALARFTANGLLDTSFGDPSSTLNSTGMTGFNILGGTTNPWGLVLDTSGRFLVSSSAYNGFRYYMATARLSAAGALDATFGNGGVVVTDFGGTTSNVAPSGGQLAVQPSDGKIVVTGYASFSLGTYTGTNFATVRLWP